MLVLIGSYDVKWSAMPKFGPNNGLTYYIEAARVAEPYWLNGKPLVGKVPSKEVADKILRLFETGNGKPARDGRKESYVTLYTYYAPIKSLLKLAKVQAQREFESNHYQTGLRWLNAGIKLWANPLSQISLEFLCEWLMQRSLSTVSL